MDKTLSRLASDFRSAGQEKDRIEIRHEAQKRTNDHRFKPSSMMEWKTEAFALWCVTYIPHLIPEVEDWQVPSLDDFFAYERVLIMWPAALGKCLAGDTRVVLADGSVSRIADMTDSRIVSFDGRNLVDMYGRWIYQGVKPTFKVTTRLGREITATGNHPFLVQPRRTGRPLRDRSGEAEWKPLGELSVGDRIAVPTSLPYFGVEQVPEHMAGLLGLWLAEGTSDLSAVRITTSSYGDKLQEWASPWGCEARIVGATGSCSAPTWSITNGIGAHRNPVTMWLRSLGMDGCTSATKHIPDEAFKWDRHSVSIMLRWLFNGDGWLSRMKNNQGSFQLGIGFASERLVRDVAHLLLRFGIVGRVRRKGSAWCWETQRRQEIKRFLTHIGIDRPSVEEFTEYQPTRNTVTEWQVVEYDPVVSIEPCGEQRVYDLSVDDLHNFVANDIIVHNSTMFSVAVPLFREIMNPDLEGIGLFKDDTEAKGFLKKIKDECSENEKLIADYGQLMPSSGDRTKKWTQHEVDFAQRTRRSARPNLHYLPYGAAVLGKRSHWRFFDDIVTLKVARSATLNRQQIEWFQVNFESGPYPPGDKASFVPGHSQIYGAMTRMSPEDLGHHLESRVCDDEARRNPYIKQFHVHVVDLLDEEHRRTVSPRYTWDQAKALESEMGAEAFAMRMRNKVITDATARFKRVYIEGGDYNNVTYPGCWDKSLAYEDAIMKGMMVTIGYDPQSGSQTRQAAEAGLVMLGNFPNGTWNPRLLDFYRGKSEILGDKDEGSQLMRIVRMAQRCNAHNIAPLVVLENNNIQRALRVGILEAGQRHGVQLRCLMSYTGDNKWDMETGLEQSVIDFENGWLSIPAMYPADKAMFQPFVEAMCAYGVSAFIDIPIAYWKARQYLFDHRGQMGARQQVVSVDRHTPPRMQQRWKRLGILNGLVIRDAYAYQEEEHDGQRVG